MKNSIVILPIVIISIALGSVSYSKSLTVEDMGRNFVNLLVNKNFTEAEKFFTEEVAKALPDNALESVWGNVTATLGRFNSIIDIKATEYGEYRVVIVTCDFELGTLGIQITFNKDAKIAGLYFLQPQLKALYTPPSYADPNNFIEIELTIDTVGWKLPATLTLPKTDKPCPAVVLVHGSGPQDRDETIGPNKPFKDLAWGLASKGIAVLRYEKRTKQYGEKSLIEGFTVDEETIDDAVSAIELLYKRKEIDKNKIFLLGHSLGGMLSPRIAERTDKIKGIIILAGTVKDLLELMPKQARYLASLDDKITEEEVKEIEELEKQIAYIKSLKVGKNEIILGAPGSYWLDLINYDPIEAIKKLSIPILILQGDRDYQVSVEDFNLWQKELKDKPNIEFKLYEKLNHLFIFGEGKPNPDEYYKPGNVAQEVVEDIAKWIRLIQI